MNTGIRKGILSLCTGLTLLTLAPAGRAEIDLSGNWLVVYHEDWLDLGTGPDIADYTGLPLTKEAAQRGLTWHASLHNLPERQCQQIALERTNRWSNTRIWKQVDPKSQALVAYRFRKEWGGMERTIWMDGRSRPPEGTPHTWAGFSLGEFEGGMLKITTTHVKQGYTRRTGVPRSDKATIVEHFMRHGDYLAISTIVQDPVFLTEPLLISSEFIASLDKVPTPFLCESVTELESLSGGKVPHYFPWKNPFLNGFSKTYGIPLEVALGGAEQMYPTFIEKRPELEFISAKGAMSAKGAQ